MKKLILFLFLVCANVQAQFIEFKESGISKNTFLGALFGPNGGLVRNMCKTTDVNTKGHPQDAYDCGNKNISGLLNMNFLSPGALGQQFYIFNDFMYWMGKNLASNKADQEPDKYFSGSGVFVIVLGTSPYLKQVVASEKICPEGKTLMVAQLKYNDGHSIVSWSQDSICLAPTDTFKIEVSNNQDNTVPKIAKSADGIDWMKDGGPTENYNQATTSPRQVRLILISKAV